MSYDKFAPMTSALLARKGEAAPSPIAGQRVPSETKTRARKGKMRSLKQIRAVAAPAKKAPSKKSSSKRRPSKAAAKRRIILTLTSEEFERVESAGRKTNVDTPRQLAHKALMAYLSAINA